MDMIDIAIAKAFATKVAAGFSNVEVDGMTINFTLNDGQTVSLTVPTPADGVSVTDVDIDANGDLICTMSDGTEINAGRVLPQKGVDYWTEEDKQEILDETNEKYNELLDQIPKGNKTDKAIHMDDSSNLELVDGKILGEMSQVTTSISSGDEYDSPTPDHPQPISVVTGDNEIKITGKNIFSIDNNQKRSLTGATFVSSDINNLVIKGTGAWGNISYVFKNPKTNNDFDISFEVISTIARKTGVTVYGSNTINYITADLHSLVSNLIDVMANSTTSINATFNSGNYPYIVIRFWNNATGTGLGSNENLTFNDIQLVYGSTLTTFEPYTEQSVIIPLGVRNLFDKSNANIQKWLIGNSTHAITSSSQERSVIVQVKPNTTYTISKMLTTRFRIGEYPTMPTVGDTLNNYKFADSETVITTTTEATTNYMVIHIVNTTSYNLQETLDSLQIEEGSIVHSYSPYGLEPIELCKIGDYQDKIYKENGKWWLEKNVQKIILNGTEADWSSYTRNNDSALAYVGVYSPSDALPTKSYNADTNPLVASNKFTRGTYTELYNRTIVNGIVRFWGTSTQEENQNIYIAVDRNVLSSYNLTGFKSWLATNTPILYYVLTTSVTTEILNTTLINQLENWLKMKTYKNITNIFTVTNNEQPILDITYRKDLETLFNNISQE